MSVYLQHCESISGCKNLERKTEAAKSDGEGRG